MNLPNKLTVLRILMIPLFLFFFFAEFIGFNYLLALVVFAAASLTDMLDGKIARERGLVTDFGKLMDPLADKLLVVSAFCCLFSNLTYLPLVVISFVLILAREFLVTSLRLLAAGKGEVLAADMWGKLKTVAQMLWICLELLGYVLFDELDIEPASDWWSSAYRDVMFVLLGVTVLVTVVSGAHYIIKNRDLLKDM